MAQYARRIVEMRDGRIIRDVPVTDRHNAKADLANMRSEDDLVEVA